MRKKYLFFQVGNFILFSVMGVACFVGCRNAQVAGTDPLLGKTRLDPPATSARSVYVERQNFDESGVVPGGGIAGGRKSVSGKVSRTAESETRTVRYYSPEDEANSENDAEKSSEKNVGNGAKSARLKWRAVGNDYAEKTENEENRIQNADSDKNSSVGNDRQGELKDGEYCYFYDFSVFPVRRVPIDENVAGSADLNGNGKEWTNGEENALFSGNVETVRTREPVSGGNSFPRMKTVQLTPDSFDPYAPHRQYERRRMEISQMMAKDFDSPDFSAQNFPVTNPAVENRRIPSDSEKTDAARNRVSALCGERETDFRNQKKFGGWEVVSTAVPSGNAEGEESFAAQSVVPSVSVGEKIQIFPERSRKEKTQDLRGAYEDPVIELLDLPVR